MSGPYQDLAARASRAGHVLGFPVPLHWRCGGTIVYCHNGCGSALWQPYWLGASATDTWYSDMGRRCPRAEEPKERGHGH